MKVGGIVEMVPSRQRRSAAQLALDAEQWAASRRAGVSVDAIAAQAGASAATVSRATRPFGSFPRATPRRDVSPDRVSVKQVAAELAVDRHVVYDLIHRGELPAQERRRGHQIERVELERWLTDQYRRTREWITANPGNYARDSAQR